MKTQVDLDHSDLETGEDKDLVLVDKNIPSENPISPNEFSQVIDLKRSGQNTLQGRDSRNGFESVLSENIKSAHETKKQVDLKLSDFKT